MERTTELAKAKVQAGFLERDRDRALRDFGEAVWGQIQKGKLALPAALSSALRAMQEAQRKVDAHDAEISDLLREGEEAASRLRSKGATSGKTAVASKGKKR